MTTCRFSDEQKLNTLLCQINSQGLVSGADAKELVKILKGMGPRPSAAELAQILHNTPGTAEVMGSRVAAHVLQHLHTHLVTGLVPDGSSEPDFWWLAEIVKWQQEYLDED